MNFFQIFGQIILFVINTTVIIDKIFLAKLIKIEVPWGIVAILFGINLFIVLPDILEINLFEMFRIKRSLGGIKNDIADVKDKIIKISNYINNSNANSSTNKTEVHNHFHAHVDSLEDAKNDTMSDTSGNISDEIKSAPDIKLEN